MRLAALLAGISVVLGLVACGDDSGEGSIVVFAAASLRDAFAEVADEYEATHPGASVELSFAGSSSLREQILGGAPADVYASANAANIDRLVDAGAVEQPVAFASNRLRIAVPVGNPAGVDGLDDFADRGPLIGLCAEEVPCGALGHEVLRRAGVVPAPDTAEPDVRALLTRIEAGELDAGIVYATDVLAAGGAVDGIDIPPDHNHLSATLHIAPVAGSGDEELASSFVAFVAGPQGQDILRQFGFGAP